MKTDIHPDYQAVVFRDLGSGETFLTRSTVTSDKTIELDGVEYPVIDVEISSASHPFYTGKQRIMDSAGRVEKFNQRFKNFGGSEQLTRRSAERPRFGGAFCVPPSAGIADQRIGQLPSRRSSGSRRPIWMKYSVRLAACARAHAICRVCSSSTRRRQPGPRTARRAPARSRPAATASADASCASSSRTA